MASAPKIPLKCDICPKKPRFSDVSHLLTHISSKTHLSNIFKARVRLEVDTESRRLIEDYDQWYAEWNIQDLLAERMSQKDSKVARPRTRGGARAGTGRRRRSSTGAASGQPGNIQSAGGMPPVDPRLPPYPGPLNNMPYPNLAHPSMQTGYQPYFQQFQRGPTTQWSMLQGQIPHPVTIPQFVFGHSNGGPGTTSRPSSATGVKKRRAAADACNRRLKKLRAETRDDSATPTPASDTIDDSDEEEDDVKSTPVEPDAVSQSVIIDGDRHVWPNMVLKGVYWPGMGCFDAAPPHQRSQRNQKKTTESYMLLYISSTRVADAPFEVIYRLDEDEVWIFVKSRVITGNPSPSSIASSSPTRASPPKRALRQRFTREQSIADQDDEANELDIQRVVFGIRRGKLPVLRQEDYDDETASVNTFLGRPRTSQRFDNSAIHKLNQENERTDSASAHATVKTDFEDAESATHVALPSIERVAGFPRDVTFDNGFMAPPGQVPTLPPPSPFLQSSPHGQFTVNGYNNSGWPRFLGANQAMTTGFGQQSMGSPQAFHGTVPGNAVGFGSYQNSRSAYGMTGYQNSGPDTHANARLDNLATVASDFNNQLSVFDNPLPNASPSHNSQFFTTQMSPNYGMGSSTLQGTDWLRASPGRHAAGFHGRQSSQQWHMPTQLPTGHRSMSCFFDTQDRHTPFTDTKPIQDFLGVNHGDGLNRGSLHNTGFGHQRLTSNNPFSGYGLTGGPDNKADEPHSLLPPVTSAMSTYGFSASVSPNALSQAAVAEPTTPSARLMPPPPLPGSAEAQRFMPAPASSISSRTRGQARIAVAQIEAQNLAHDQSDTGSEASLPQLLEQANNATASAALVGAAVTAITDDDRTVTAPGTPSGHA